MASAQGRVAALTLLGLMMTACGNGDEPAQPSVAAEANSAEQAPATVQSPILGAQSVAVKTDNLVVDADNRTIYLPVKPGTNLDELDPDFKTASGIQVQPAGPQDFSEGPVAYTLRAAGRPDQTYTISASVDANPVLEGYYADPEIFYSEREEKYYLYPTSDGHMNWSGTYFEVFSSPDLITWENEGVILDLEQDVAWADRNAWAPAAAERRINGEYKYFYYFTAAQKIGVAVADNPEGPYVDSGEPLIAFKPEGVTHGQEIDPDVFLDPISGQSYLYWGNSYLAAAELNDDMVSINRKTLKVLTPDSTFREGVEVFYRGGTYYFLWSENDTRSEDYRVRYATAESPTGPLQIPEDNLILAKDPEAGIYGTGHNSVVKAPNSDCWYIVYHRFNRPHGIGMGRAAGFHREVAIDRLTFDDTGAIQRVQPTLQGLAAPNTACP